MTERKDWIDAVGPYEYRGHQIAGIARSGNVSSGATAISSNAYWYLWIDGDEKLAVGLASPEDSIDRVQELLERAADRILGDD